MGLTKRAGRVGSMAFCLSWSFFLFVDLVDSGRWLFFIFFAQYFEDTHVLFSGNGFSHIWYT
jgi:hypothetical protein